MDHLPTLLQMRQDNRQVLHEKISNSHAQREEEQMANYQHLLLSGKKDKSEIQRIIRQKEALAQAFWTMFNLHKAPVEIYLYPSTLLCQ